MAVIRLTRPAAADGAGVLGNAPIQATNNDVDTAFEPQDDDEDDDTGSEYEAGPSAGAAKRKRARSGFRDGGPSSRPAKITLKMGPKPIARLASNAVSSAASPASTNSGRKRKSSNHDGDSIDSSQETDTAQDFSPSPSRSPSPVGFTGHHNVGDDYPAAPPSRMVELKGSKFLTKLLRGSKVQNANGEYVGSTVKDLGGLELKADHQSRPLWIDGDGKMWVKGGL